MFNLLISCKTSMIVMTLVLLAGAGCTAAKGKEQQALIMDYENAKIAEPVPEQNQADKLTEPQKRLQIISIPEMESIAEIEAFQFSKELNPASRNDLKAKLKGYQAVIKEIKLENISRWAKEQMKNYQLAGNFLDNAIVEQFYQNKDLSVLEIKVTDLPSHTPIVKRFLYLIAVFDSSQQIKKIFITIRGHAEE